MSYDDSTNAFTDDSGSSVSYPPWPALPPILSGKSEKNRPQFVQRRIESTKRELNFEPTPIEEQALRYYEGRAFTEEVRGLVYGKLAGLAIATAWNIRMKKPGYLGRTVGRMAGLNPKAQLLFSRLNVVFALYWFGAFYGFTAHGLPAAAAVIRDQKKDPNLARFVAIREKWMNSSTPRANNEREAAMVDRHKTIIRRWSQEGESQDGAPQERDPQSLGGADFYGTDESNSASKAEGESSSYQAPSSYQKPPSQQNPSSISVDNGNNDPFSVIGDSPEGSSNSSGSRSGQQSGGLSAWERIRRGEKPASQEQSGANAEETSRVSSWRQRAQSKQDSFTFSNSDSEKEMAKTEAQRDFDQRVERERRGEGLDGFVSDSSEGRSRGR